MDHLKMAKQFLLTGRDWSYQEQRAEATADLLSAVAAALISIAERMGEPIDSHPADLVEIAGKLYSGCGEDIEQHEIGRCPLCQRPWAECDCAAQNYHKALR